jgi:cobalt-zinc-cadmium efflux system protein
METSKQAKIPTGHSSHSGHDHPVSPGPRLLLSIALNLLITVLQVVGGLLANSLGLLSDATHNLSDVVALTLSYWAVRLGARGPTPRRTFAYKRAEILVALFNSAALVGISVFITVEAVQRLLHPQRVDGLLVVAFAGVGLAANALAALLLRSQTRDLNIRSAFLHLVGDAVTSFGVMLSGLVVYLTGWQSADAVISILVCLWMSREAFRIIRSTVNVLMEGTPEALDFSAVERAMLGMGGVRGVHDLHIWSISSSDLALSAHVEVEDAILSATSDVAVALKQMLAREFGVEHATLELESAGGVCSGSVCIPPSL